MAGVNRREFLTAAATVPTVSSIIQPVMAGLVDRDGQHIDYNPVRESFGGIIAIYGRMDITGKELANVTLDGPWEKLIDEQCEDLKQSLKEYVRQVAMRKTAQEHILPRIYPPSININPMKIVNGRYV
jgi:hypothetical protein